MIFNYLKLLKRKNAAEMWQLILLIMALVSLVLVIMFMSKAQGSASKFTQWLGWLS